MLGVALWCCGYQYCTSSNQDCFQTYEKLKSIHCDWFSQIFRVIITHHNKSENPLQKIFTIYFNISVDKVTEIIVKTKTFSVKNEPGKH